MNTKVLAAMLMVGMMVGSAIAWVPDVKANDGGGSNDPPTTKDHILYAMGKETTDSTTNTVSTEGFLSVDKKDKDGDSDGQGFNELGLAMSNAEPLVVDIPYAPVPSCKVRLDTTKDGTGAVALKTYGIIGGNTGANVAHITYSVAVVYGDQVLAEQEFTEDVVLETTTVAQMSFKAPSEIMTFSAETPLILRLTISGGAGTTGIGIALQGASYIDLPVLQTTISVNGTNVLVDDSGKPTNETSDLTGPVESGNETGNTTDDTGGNEQTSNVDNTTTKKTPGFELVALMAAVGVATVLLRRKK
jgi:hypothetical protein